ncbi:hypothetical protein B7463_g10394, partial [Scytalidium lignicola]
MDSFVRVRQSFQIGVQELGLHQTAFKVGPEANRLYHALKASKLPIGDKVRDYFGNLTQQASFLIDPFLSEGYEEYIARIIEMAHMDDAASEREP